MMVSDNDFQTLEFNCRFGDPETQAVLPRLNTDLVEMMLATVEQGLSQWKKSGRINWDRRACVCVVCASGGYPGKYEKGKEISGLDGAQKLSDIVIFHAGTKKSIVDSPRSVVKYYTNGGRVLGVTGLGNSIKEAITRTYQAVARINFEGMHYRKDIAGKSVEGREQEETCPSAL